LPRPQYHISHYRISSFPFLCANTSRDRQEKCRSKTIDEDCCTYILAEFFNSFIDPSSLSTNPWFLPGNNLMEQQNAWNLRKFNLNHYSIKILSLQDFSNSKSSMSDH
jgi:hypothetical protein